MEASRDLEQQWHEEEQWSEANPEGTLVSGGDKPVLNLTALRPASLTSAFKSAPT